MWYILNMREIFIIYLCLALTGCGQRDYTLKGQVEGFNGALRANHVIP